MKLTIVSTGLFEALRKKPTCWASAFPASTCLKRHELRAVFFGVCYSKMPVYLLFPLSHAALSRDLPCMPLSRCMTFSPPVSEALWKLVLLSVSFSIRVTDVIIIIHVDLFLTEPRLKWVEKDMTSSTMFHHDETRYR